MPFMKIPRQFLAIALLLLIPSLSFAAGLPPWQFGMTKEQVASFKQFGPYKSFKNGDLETYNGIFRAHKENVQFFFRNGRLVRIGVYLYEGEDKQKVAAMFTRVYRFLEKEIGRRSACPTICKPCPITNQRRGGRLRRFSVERLMRRRGFVCVIEFIPTRFHICRSWRH